MLGLQYHKLFQVLGEVTLLPTLELIVYIVHESDRYTQSVRLPTQNDPQLYAF
jgi:hypothetical protein